MPSKSNYLKQELYQLIKNNDDIFHFLQEGTLDGLWYWDLEHPENEWMNESFWRTLGYEPNTKQHLAKEWQNIINHEDLAIALENFQKHCENPNHAYDQIVRYRHKEGHTIWIRCRGIAIRDSNGTSIRMLGAHTDITEQKQSEQQYRDRLALLNSLHDKTKLALDESEQLFEYSPDAILKVDVDGNILKANHQATILFGYNKKELKSCSINALIPSSIHPNHKNHIKHYFTQGGARKMGADRGKLQAIDKLGNTFHVEVTLNLITTALGKQAIATIRSVEEKEQLIASLQKQIIENQKLERFAFVASHDLQEPLRKIHAFVELLDSQLSDLKVSTQDTDFSISRIKDASSRMRDMIKDTLKLSQINQSAITYTQCNIYNAIVEAHDILRDKSTFEGATINIEKSDATIRGDMSLLIPLFQNLLSNSLKFKRHEEPSIVKLSIIESIHYVEVKIIDNGIGIIDNFSDNIFEPFIRLNSKDDYPGSGIGLAVCKQIMDIHDGDISYTNNSDHGTCFTLRFKVNR